MPVWETRVTLPSCRADEVIEKLRELAHPTEIVVEIEAETLWQARGLIEEARQEILAMTGEQIVVAEYARKKGEK